MARFADITNIELENILQNKDSDNTKKATSVSVKVLRDYLREKGLDDQFETLSDVQLDTLLCKFYVEARNGKGSLYKKSTLQSMRHGINRHLNTVNKNNNYDIINGLEYSKSRSVFDAMKKELKRQGKAVIIHKDIIPDEDLKSMYNYFEDLADPTKLQQKVFFDIMMYFGRRGRENLHALKVLDFAIETDSVGLKYVKKVTDESTKNHQDDDSSSGSGVMYEVKGTSLCPVQSFTKYLSTVNPKIDSFFQRAKRNGPFILEVTPWFDAAPLGRNTLGQMMANISKAAGLSKMFTNHCIRATVVHLLDAGNIPSQHIMSVTGHKSELSLKTYSGYTDESMKKRMAQILGEKTITQGNKNPVQVASSSYNYQSEISFLGAVDEPPSNIQHNPKSSLSQSVDPTVTVIAEGNHAVGSQIPSLDRPAKEITLQPSVNKRFTMPEVPSFDEAFEEFVKDIPSDTLITANNTNTNNTRLSQYQFTPYLKDCNVTINYNFNK